MINIQKSKPELPEVNRSLLKFAVEKTLSHFEKSNADITIRLTENNEIKALNHTYRDISTSTDVLSFNQDIIDPETGRLYLGDIIISLEKANEQAPNHNLSLDQECAFLAIHGTLHLLGYDHNEPEENKVMWQVQDQIFFEINKEFKEIRE